MINTALLRAWPNYLTVPLMLALWIIVISLGVHAFGGKPWHSEGKQ